MKAHLIDCTYCVHRWVTPGDKKRNIRETERCRITHSPIPAPSEPGRFCENFKQVGHDCVSCFS
jgi:hypothetical protein